MNNVPMARAAIVCLLAVTGCSGGGSATPPPANAAATNGTARGTATIVIPAHGKSIASNRRAQWVSPSTKSIYITITRESDHLATTTSATTTPTSPNCVPGSGGSTVCTLPFSAPPGVDDIGNFAGDYPDPGYAYDLSTYQKNGVTFTAGSDNSMSFVMGGIVASALGVHARTRNDHLRLRWSPGRDDPADRRGCGREFHRRAARCGVVCRGPKRKWACRRMDARDPCAGRFRHVRRMPDPGTGSVGNSSGAPTASGLGVIDTSLVPALKMHYSGAGASTVTVTIGTTSLDFSTQNLPSIFTTLTLTAS